MNGLANPTPEPLPDAAIDRVAVPSGVERQFGSFPAAAPARCLSRPLPSPFSFPAKESAWAPPNPPIRTPLERCMRFECRLLRIGVPQMTAVAALWRGSLPRRPKSDTAAKSWVPQGKSNAAEGTLVR